MPELSSAASKRLPLPLEPKASVSCRTAAVAAAHRGAGKTPGPAPSVPAMPISPS
ncbi:hypothetical protein [Streptomyces parvulus]|uniref:hypothetical protein n=1 Tax=Streptomyces parvulus TaxID=146923 RepID=UPI0027E11C19|nr:hypothetical protein [Streptomyces parvulus]